MRNSLRLAFVFVCLFRIQPFAPVSAETSQRSPKDEIQTTIDEILKVAQSLRGDSNKAARREKLRTIISPIFDFKEMAKRSLGAHWNSCSAEEQKEFVTVFSNLLARTYLQRIEKIEPNMVKIEKESVEARKATVKTLVSHKGDTFSIQYDLSNRENSWKVYDVQIESTSLIAVYRGEFPVIIRKEKCLGLLKRLKDKHLQK